MKKKDKVVKKRTWIGQKYRNLNTARMTFNYDIAFKVSLEILERYPDDNHALYCYAGCLCIEGRFEEARGALETLLEKIPIEKCKYVLICLIHVELNLENFDKAYEYFLQFKKFFPLQQMKAYERFFNYKLFNDLTGSKSWYAYDENYALNHIIDRHVLGIGRKTSSFSEGIDVKQLFDDVSSLIQDIPRHKSFNPFLSIDKVTFNDLYFFEFPCCGYDCGHICDYLVVITPPFEKQVISFYPILDVPAGNPIHKFKQEKVMTKEYKPLSQIDKFNRRWRQ